MRPVSIERASETVDRALADARHEIDEHQDEQRDPGGERRRQPDVKLAEQHQRGERVDRDEPQRVADLHHRFAQRRAGLDDFRGDAPGEIVGEEADRLPEHIAVRLPAHQVGEGRRQRLLHQKVVQDGRDRARHHHDERHPGEGPAIVVKHVRRRRRLQHVDDLADIAEDRHLDQRHDEADRQKRGQSRPHLAGVEPVEAAQGRRRHVDRRRPEGVDDGLEESEHGWSANGRWTLLRRGRRCLQENSDENAVADIDAADCGSKTAPGRRSASFAEGASPKATCEGEGSFPTLSSRPGLSPCIHSVRPHAAAAVPDWIAGSSPAMTT